MMVSVSVPPVSIQLAGGYLNRKPKVEFVKVSQSAGGGLGVTVGGSGVDVTVAVGGVSGVDVCVAVGVGGSTGPVGVAVGTEGVPTVRAAPTDSIVVRTLSPLE